MRFNKSEVLERLKFVELNFDGLLSSYNDLKKDYDNYKKEAIEKIGVLNGNLNFVVHEYNSLLHSIDELKCRVDFLEKKSLNSSQSLVLEKEFNSLQKRFVRKHLTLLENQSSLKSRIEKLELDQKKKVKR